MVAAVEELSSAAALAHRSRIRNPSACSLRHHSLAHTHHRQVREHRRDHCLRAVRAQLADSHSTATHTRL